MYDLSAEDVLGRKGGHYLLRRKFGGSLIAMLKYAFPDHPWQEWRFGRVSKDFWKTPRNRREYLDWLGDAQLKISNPEDPAQLTKWYGASLGLFRQNFGAGLLRLYFDDNYIKMLQDSYPNFEWVMWRFAKVPESHWASLENQRAFFDYVGAKYLSISSADQNGELHKWYDADWNMLRRQEGCLRSILGKYYTSSPSAALCAIYPAHKWHLHMFSKDPQRYHTATSASLAKNPHDLRKTVLQAALRLGITTPEAWYKVPFSKVKRTELAVLLTEDRDLCAVLNDAYSGDVVFLPWLFPKVPERFWTSRKNRLQYARWFEEKKGLKAPSDWRGVSLSSLVAPTFRGDGFLRFYGNSLRSAIEDIFPDHIWNSWDFVGASFWEYSKNRSSFVTWAGSQLGLGSLEDWYRVSQDDLHRIGGATLLLRYGGSPSALLADTIPEHKWVPWKFDKLPRAFWDSMENQKAYFEWAARQLNVGAPSGWYDVTTRQIHKERGGSLLNSHYKGSLIQALRAVYHHHEWLPWMFKSTQLRWWTSPDNQRAFLEWAGVKLQIVDMDGWYAVAAHHQIVALGGHRLLDANNSFGEALRNAYPNHTWDPLRLRYSRGREHGADQETT